MTRKKARAKPKKTASRDTVLSFMRDTKCSAAEAARKFGVNPSTVRSWVTRAKARVERGSATHAEAGFVEKAPRKRQNKADPAKAKPPARRPRAEPEPTGELVLGHMQGATRRILLYMDSDEVTRDGRQTAALARALVDLTRVCPELRQMHRGDEGGEDLDEEARRVAAALGLDPTS